MMKTAAVETSINAFRAHRAAGKSQQQRERIIAFISENGGDWSIGELAWALNLEKSTVSARVNEALYETQELIARPKRVDRESGVMIRPVTLPYKQGMLFR
jgi:predicted transcriptional regulator